MAPCSVWHLLPMVHAVLELRKSGELCNPVGDNVRHTEACRVFEMTKTLLSSFSCSSAKKSESAETAF